MLISIITINYNDKVGLENTVKSVKNQDFKTIEHIIIDGNSSDGSKAIIEQYKDCFSYWVSESDTGIYNAMNKGVKVAKGEYLLFLNSGDSLYNKKTLENSSHFIDGNHDIYYGDLMFLSKENNRRVSYPEKVSFQYFYNNGYLPHPASFIKKTLFETIGLYNENYKIVADWDFFIQAICKYNVSYKYIDVIISNFDTNGISADSKHEKTKLIEKNNILKTHFSTYLSDYDELLHYKRLFQLNRFKILKTLESNRLAQKANSIWLNFLKLIFIKA